MSTIPDIKYRNSKWLNPLRDSHFKLVEGIELMHNAICMADDIADRATDPRYAAGMLWNGIFSTHLLTGTSEWPKFFQIINQIYRAEINNYNFIPGKFSVDEELKTWATRSSLFDLYYQAWCVAYPEIDTQENREWFEKFKKFSLISDDCADILSEEFEDLRQLRRNYVILKTYGTEGYFGWKSKKMEIMQKAYDIREHLYLEEPQEEKLKVFFKKEQANA